MKTPIATHLKQNQIHKRFNGFDVFVLAGGAMNLLVITYLVGYWLLH
jgi:hypothetical protein